MPKKITVHFVHVFNVGLDLYRPWLKGSRKTLLEDDLNDMMDNLNKISTFTKR